jgi:hypothetical protein
VALPVLHTRLLFDSGAFGILDDLRTRDESPFWLADYLVKSERSGSSFMWASRGIKKFLFPLSLFVRLSICFAVR